MGKSTISTGPFSMSQTVSLPEGSSNFGGLIRNMTRYVPSNGIWIIFKWFANLKQGQPWGRFPLQNHQSKWNICHFQGPEFPKDLWETLLSWHSLLVTGQWEFPVHGLWSSPKITLCPMTPIQSLNIKKQTWILYSSMISPCFSWHFKGPHGDTPMTPV